MDENNNDINEVQKPVDEPVIDIPQPEPTATSTVNSDPVSEQTNNQAPKSGKKLPIVPIIAVVVVVLLVAIVGLGGKGSTTPDKFYANMIGKGLDLVVDTVNNERTDNAKVGLDIELDLGEDMKVLEDTVYGKLITTTEPELSFYTDDSKIEVGLHADYDGDDLLNADMILDLNEKKGVVQLKEMSDSYFDLELDEDTFESFEEYFAGESKVPTERVKIVKEEINKQIVAEHATKTTEKIEVDGKTKSTTAYTYKTDLKSIIDAMVEVCENLQENEKYLNTFGEDENPKETLDMAIDALKDGDYSEDDLFEITVYMSGKSFVKCTIIVTSEDESSVEVNVVKTKDGIYDYDATLKTSEDDEDSESISGTITVDKDGSKKGTVTVSGKYDEYSVKVIVNYEKLDKKTIPDVSSLDVKLLEDLTEEELENLEDSKLYEVILELSGGSSYSYDDDDDYYSSYTYDDYYSYDEEDDDDYYSTYSFDEDDYDWNF